MTEQAVKISITLKVGERVTEIEKEIQVAQMEPEIRAEMQKMGKVMLEEILQELDKRLMAKWNGQWENLGREKRSWATSLGKVEMIRRVYRDEQGRRRKPLDELLGIERYERDSKELKGMGAYLGSELSYRQAAGQLSWLIGEEINKNRIQCQVWEAGNGLADQEEQEREAIFREGAEVRGGKAVVETLYGESDGVWIHLQREEKRKQEVRVGILYGGKKAIGKGRNRLTDKCCVTAMVANSQEWQEQLLKTAHQYYDLTQTRQMVVGGDGNGWVWNSFESFCIPHEHVLDRYHLFRAARTAFGDWEKAKQVVARIRSKGYEDMKDTLEACRLQAQGKQREKIQTFIRYVSHLSAGLQDLSLRVDCALDTTQVCSLGAIEGNVDKLVVHRMKGRGCSWRIPGARAMLALLRYRQQLRDDYRAFMDQIQAPAVTQPCSVNKKGQEVAIHASIPIFRGPDQFKPWVQTFKRSLGCAALSHDLA